MSQHCSLNFLLVENDRPLDLRIRTAKRSANIWSPATLCENERSSPGESLSEENSPRRGSRGSTGSWDNEPFPASAIRASSIDRSFQVNILMSFFSFFFLC